MRSAAGAWHRHREGLLLGGLMLALSAAIAVEAMPPTAAAPQPLAAHPGSVARLGTGGVPASNDPESADLWMNTVLGRPLFALDRRPAAIDATGDGSLPRLSGTIRFGQTALAIFDPPAASDPAHGQGQPLVLGAGAELSGWTIEDVSDARVLLTKGGESRTLQLAFSKSTQPAAPAAKGIAALRLLHGKKTNVFWQP